MEEYHLSEIPKEFHSYEKKAPFEKCLECEKNLLDGETPYVIEKALKHHPEYDVSETIIDYALCMDCMEEMKKGMSKDSMEAIQNFFAERINPEDTSAKLNMSPEENIQKCMVSGRDLADCREYQLFAFCLGGKISYEMPPYMISGQVMDEILPLLSEKTTEDLNGFMNKHFSPDPSLMEPISPKFVLI